jgi:hypothetical protein
MYIAIILTIAGAVWFWYTQRRGRAAVAAATDDQPTGAGEDAAGEPAAEAGAADGIGEGSGQEVPAEIGADRGGSAAEGSAAADGTEQAG